MSVTLFICGDSTAASYPDAQAPLTGWGQALCGLLPGVAIDNRAIAGRSTRTFLNEGRLGAIEPLLKAGDIMLVQFGHNDAGDRPERHTEAWGDFTDNLDRFIDAARRRDALPVLLTPICVRCWEGGVLLPSHGEYPEAVRTLARRRRVPLIDLYEGSREIVAAMGERDSRALYMRPPPGEYPGWPDGATDDTHTREAGARAFAEVVARELTEITAHHAI